MGNEIELATTAMMEWVNRFPYEAVLVLDIETDGVDPFAKDSKVVWVGLWNPILDSRYIIDCRDKNKATKEILGAIYSESPEDFSKLLLVGHNIKFDLLFLRTKLGLDLSYCHLWDTQIGEYILTGQAEKWASLDSLGQKYLGEKKDDIVGTMIKAGTLVSTIDDDMVMEYLKKDLEITGGVYYEQLERYANESDDLRKVALIQMEALRAYVELEWNGMHFDRTKMVNAHFTCEQQLATNEQSLRTMLKAWGAPDDTNLTSNHTISTLLWGSPGIKYRKQELVGKYKNGKDKFKFVDYTWTPEWSLDPKDFNVEEKAHGCYDVSENTLDKMSDILRSTQSPVENGLADYLDVLRDSRKIAKVDGTYLVPLIEQIDNSDDGRVHAQVNQCSTHTGRTSSNNPNQQNMPPVVRSFLKPSTDDGVLLESDYSQLEVCALALLTLDQQLVADINNGVDIHFETGKSVMRWNTPADMTKAQRRTVKGVNFGLIYGGGAPTIAAQTGAPVPLVKQLIKAFYARYPRVREWQRELIELVESLGQVCHESPVLLGQHAKVAKYMSVTGRLYTFTESVVPENYRRNGVVLNFKPTEIKNYPVQGLATADIVPMMVALTMYWPKGVFPELVAVVHDSMLWDCEDRNKATEVRNLLDQMVSYSLPTMLNGLFNVYSPVKFKMDHEIKKSW